MRGNSDEAMLKREKVAERIQERIKECKERDFRDKILRMMENLKESAEEVVGREFNQKLAPFMDGHLDEMKEKTEEINALLKAVLAAKTKPEKDRPRKERSSATAAWRRTKRKWKAVWIKKKQLRWRQQCSATILGRSTKGVKELGIAYAMVSQKGRVDHTLDQLRTHCSKLGSTPNVVRDENLDAITIKRPWI